MRRKRPAENRRRQRRWIAAGGGVVVLGAAAALLLTTCTTISIDEETVFFPRDSVTPGNFDYPGLELEQHWIDSNGTRLRAWRITQDEAIGTVLLFGGNGFYLVQSSAFIEGITEYPVNLIMWDYRGYGESEGTPTVEGTKRDGLAVYDWATGELGTAADRLLLHGHSLGTFVASYVAANRRSAGLVLQNPATNVDDWVKHLAPWYARLFVNLDIDPALRNENNIAHLRQASVPVLIGGGKQDMVTAWEMARNLHGELPPGQGELVIVDEASHNTLFSYSSFTDRYEAFVQDRLAAQ